ncbi:MAG: hypothetical protein U0350_27210 [Caldilineaceae bacterium]
MGWSFSELIQFAQDLVGADTGNDEDREENHTELGYSTFDDESSEYGATDLSIDEVRQSLDEYENLLRS